MKITRLELTNFRVFSNLTLEDLADLVVLVSPNGMGKSTILEAIIGAHDIVIPYHSSNYPFGAKMLDGRSFPTWPPFLREPVKYGEKRATIDLRVEANEEERAYLKSVGVSEATGHVRIQIESGRFITERTFDATAQKLFEFHDLSAAIGYIDYFRPFRYYPNQGIGQLDSIGTETQLRETITSFDRDWQSTQKWMSFKTFVVTAVVNDSTESRVQGRDVDTLAPFRETFDYFFFPKRFIGPLKSPHSNQLGVLVETPYGMVEVDNLSDGEKEILNIFGYLYQTRHLENVILWDTPELHLNAALESRLPTALSKVATRNQYWLATHSLELIGRVPLETVYVIRQKSHGLVVERIGEPKRKSQIEVYKELGASVGLQLISSVNVFVEGKEAESDKRSLERLIGDQLPAVNFFAGEDCDRILMLGTKANQLLEQASANGDFLAILDRDYREDEKKIDDMEKRYGGRVFVWRVHELENILLDPDIVLRTLRHNDRTQVLDTEEKILAALKGVADGLKYWIAADWVRWEIHQSLKRPPGQIKYSDPLNSLREYATILQNQSDKLVDGLDEKFARKLEEVEKILRGENWLKLLPGKQILEKFLAQHTAVVKDGGPKTLDKSTYITSAVSITLDNKLELKEIERLKRHILLQIENNK